MTTVSTGVQRRLRSLGVGYAAAAVLLGIVAVVVAIGVVRNGTFAYPLDDPYIHLALGKNLAEHGVLGINAGQFASATSSPAWPLLIAAIAWWAGPLIGIPLALATLIGAVVVIGIDRWALGQHFSVTERCVLQVLLLVAVPLPMMALIGMEHTLQVGTCFLLVALTIETISGDSSPRTGLNRDLMLAGASFLAAAARYEAVFVLIPLGALLLLHRRWATTVFMAVGAAIPVATLALVNLWHGWPALPASVLTKTLAERDASGVVKYLPSFSAAGQLPYTPRLVAIVGVTVALWVYGRWSRGQKWPAQATQWSAVAIVATLTHLGYSQLGWLYRYEAYLVALCVGASAVSVHAILSSEATRRVHAILPRLAGAAVCALLLIALADGIRILPTVDAGMTEINAQQMHMAEFAATACPGCTVAVNDIGAVALYGGGTVFDDFGLANRDVLDAKLAGDWTTERLNSLAEQAGASLAMVYTEQKWIPGVPPSWTPLGSWTLRNARIVGESTVRFYSLDPGRTTQLKESLVRFPPPPRTDVVIER